jgi:hypothetical protein
MGLALARRSLDGVPCGNAIKQTPKLSLNLRINLIGFSHAILQPRFVVFSQTTHRTSTFMCTAKPHHFPFGR